MKIHSRPFKQADFYALGALVDSLDNINPESLYELEDHPSYTIEFDSEVVMSFGALPQWDGVMELWAMVSLKFKAHPNKLEVFPLMQGLLIEVAKRDGVRRFQSTIRPDWKDGKVWSSLLQFKHESRMVAWCSDGSDMDRYVWLARDHINGDV